MEARRASTRFTYIPKFSSTALGRRYATRESRIRWPTSALDRIGSGNTATSRDVLKNLELLNEPLDQKLIDFDQENQNFYEKYDVTMMTEQILMLYY